jgi:hypothetical protein
MAWSDPRTWVDSEFVTAALMNAHLRDNLNASAPHLVVRKTADQSVVSSTTQVDDDTLKLTVAANEVWNVQFNVLHSAAAAGDIRIGFSWPSGNISFSGTGDNESATTTFYIWQSSTSPHAGWAFNGLGTGLKTFVCIEGVFTNGGTAGDLKMRGAQGTSNAPASVVHANSTLYAVKLA